MISKILDRIADIKVTGVAVTIIEKFQPMWKPTQEVDTNGLQSAIERHSQPIIRSRRTEIESKRNAGSTFDFLTIDLQNNGEGVAKNLYVRPSLVVSYGPDLDDQTHVDIEESCFLANGGFELGPHYFPLGRVDRRERTSKGGVLHPNDGTVTFSAQIEFQDIVREGDGREYRHPVSIAEATRRLYDAGFHDMSFEIYVIYRDVNDNIHAEQVLGRTGEFTPGMNLEDIESTRYSMEPGSYDRVLNKVRDTYLYPF